ncbi:MAG TPA: TetR family transcriptional regulator [Usitatibacter sp.]|nr:TetR family transcriptional regulator [Usitatibacter sp.]
MRHSREESLRTRRRIVLAARRVFALRGVSRTTMEQIAAAAGVTRGAVYGHFADKAALFQCMREQVKLPLVDVIDSALLDSRDDPLAAVERFLLAVFDALRDDAATRETLRILNFKCEYVGEIGRDMQRQARRAAELSSRLERAYRRAARSGRLRRGVTPRLAALETTALLVGMVRLWLLEGPVRRLRDRATALARAHVASLRAE